MMMSGSYEHAKSLHEDLGASITTINFEDVDIIQNLFYGTQAQNLQKFTSNSILKILKVLILMLEENGMVRKSRYR